MVEPYPEGINTVAPATYTPPPRDAPLGSPFFDSVWSKLHGKPYITVSAKGIANGQSDIPNDGADFGPDTPGTQTSGLQEALAYALSLVEDNVYTVGWMTPEQLSLIPTIKLGAGIFLLNDNVSVLKSNYYYGIKIEGSGPSTILKDNTTSGITCLDLVGTGIDVGLYGSGYTVYSYVSDLVIVSNDAGTSLYGLRLNRESTVKNVIITGQFSEAHVEIGYSCGLEDSYIVGFNTNGITIGGVVNYGAIIKSSGNAINYIKNVHDNNYYTTTVTGNGPTFNHSDYYASIIINTAPWLLIESSVFGVIYQPSGTVSNGYTMNIGIISSYTNNNGGMPGQINWLSGNPLNVYIYNSFLSNYVTGAGIIYTGGVSTPISLHIENTQNPHNTYYPVISAVGTPVTTDLILDIKGNNTGLSVPSVTTPSIPASGTAQQNTNPYPVKVYINGGALTEIQITINGTAYTVYSNSTASAVYEGFTLPVGASITLTYTTAPAWTWVPE